MDDKAYELIEKLAEKLGTTPQYFALFLVLEVLK